MIKYFIIGLNKTGTTSIKIAIEFALNSKRLNEITPKLRLNSLEKEMGIIRLTHFLSEKYNINVFKDRPWNTNFFYKELHNYYSNSKFILTIRDEKEWWESVVKWLDARAIWTKEKDEESIKKELNEKFKLYNKHFNCQSINQQDYIKYYQLYNNSALNYFKDNPNFYALYLPKDFNWLNIQKIVNLDEETMKNNILKSLKERDFKGLNNADLDGEIKDWRFLISNKNKLT